MTHLLDSLHLLLNPLDLTFNLYSAHPTLIVSNDLRTVKYSPTKQPYPEHPERFISAPQILCSQGFSRGEHVWVVEVGASTMWSLGVCYNSIPRRGDHSRLGHNSVSWRLQWKNSKLTVCQSSCNVALGEVTNPSQKIEIALDYERGTLTFHSTKGRREHIYTFRTVFREIVYPAFSIHSNTPESWITLHEWNMNASVVFSVVKLVGHLNHQGFGVCTYTAFFFQNSVWDYRKVWYANMVHTSPFINLVVTIMFCTCHLVCCHHQALIFNSHWSGLLEQQG